MRPKQHTIIDDLGTLATNDDVTEHLVDLGYDSSDGNLETVTDNSTSTAREFTYDYDEYNSRLLKTVVGPVHTVTNNYEVNRNILAEKINQETVTDAFPSTFAYTVNELGQRTSVGAVSDFEENSITTDNPVN